MDQWLVLLTVMVLLHGDLPCPHVTNAGICQSSIIVSTKQNSDEWPTLIWSVSEGMVTRGWLLFVLLKLQSIV
jgi:hypothetical protein